MSTRVLQVARSAVLAVALAAVFAATIGTTSGQVKPRVKALTLTPIWVPRFNKARRVEFTAR